MMFAHGEHFDVFENNHSVVAFLEYRIGHDLCNSQTELQHLAAWPICLIWSL